MVHFSRKINMHFSAWPCMTVSKGGGGGMWLDTVTIRKKWGGGEGGGRNIVANAMEENYYIVSYSIFKRYIC
jgi:hypothetical protein